MAAHLAGAIAANTTLPVIGIPLKSAALDGLDALLSTVQMPSGVPVATVAIDGAVNAALLAVQILAVSDEGLAEKLKERKESAAEKARSADRRLAEQFNKYFIIDGSGLYGRLEIGQLRCGGSDITAGYRAVELMRAHVARTMTPGALKDIGGFGGLFELGPDRNVEAVLVSGTVGVGTK
jgi:glycogen debranching enzyme